MKNKIVIILSWSLVLITMMIIFNFSSESSEESTKTSGDVVEQVLGIFMEKEEITPSVVKKYQFPIRKAAHFGIYMLLGFCMMSAFEKTFKIKFILNILFSLITSVLYAISDEIHQSFSLERGPRVIDALIDSIGAFVGVMVFAGLFLIYNKLVLLKINSIVKKN